MKTVLLDITGRFNIIIKMSLMYSYMEYIEHKGRKHVVSFLNDGTKY